MLGVAGHILVATACALTYSVMYVPRRKLAAFVFESMPNDDPESMAELAEVTGRHGDFGRGEPSGQPKRLWRCTRPLQYLGSVP